MKGIYFKPERIQAIIEGRETQIRRVIKPQPVHVEVCGGEAILYKDGDNEIPWRYRVGETVYIKEAFMFRKGADCRERYVGTPEEYLLGTPPFYIYKLDDTEECRDYARYYKWRSPMMMPQKAARYFITITDVGAARLQKITLSSIFAEGCPVKKADYDIDPAEGYFLQNDAFEWFIYIWNSINAKWKRVWNRELQIYEFWQFPWCEADAQPIPKTTEHPERYHCIANPWVWVYTFGLRQEMPSLAR